MTLDRRISSTTLNQITEELVQLRQQIATLAAERDQWREDANRAYSQWSAREARIERLERACCQRAQQIAVLRAALVVLTGDGIVAATGEREHFLCCHFCRATTLHVLMPNRGLTHHPGCPVLAARAVLVQTEPTPEAT